MQAAVERKFEIIGEALNQLAKLDTTLAARIPDLPQIVAFRNQLIHGYATVKTETVWNVAQSALPALLGCVNALMKELGGDGSLAALAACQGSKFLQVLSQRRLWRLQDGREQLSKAEQTMFSPIPFNTWPNARSDDSGVQRRA